ncbi:DUF6339 family protein [Mesorhizobium sp. WSM3860]|uniref:DUF6339 family protein n=1 Tax=Mesorhizobium sp. WSM3860 TaxID=2029403 RepID=UPI000BAE6E8E|nr:DUF6339 family protein [Mesorhizobium sp. WSM3860]PBC05361.1 hypothetical protein CK220_05245 [Mesorhizobium sp. WSM3860]
MTKVRFLRATALEELRANIRINLGAYRTGSFSEVSADSSYWFEHDIEFDEGALAALQPPVDGKFFEVENCAIVYRALSELSPYEARDERLWVYLSHTVLLQHARARWPIPADDDAATKHVAKHFFARDKRQVERDNVGSRLWWMAHLCARISSMDHEQALRAFLFRSDVRANLVERPTTSQCSDLFGAIVRKLATSLDGEKQLFQRSMFRRLMTEINSVGGYKLLDCLPYTQLEGILDEIIVNRLQLKSL